jgi:hypothetical protein
LMSSSVAPSPLSSSSSFVQSPSSSMPLSIGPQREKRQKHHL